MDDRNDNPGAPGECSGHEWEARQVMLGVDGARMVLGCKWCDAVSYVASDQDKA